VTPARRAAQCASFLVLTATFGTETASAQTNTAEIAGVVRDVSGAVLPGATVTAIQPSTSIVVERTADVEGRFILPAMPIGVWNVTVSFAGFAPETRHGVVLEIGRTTHLEFALAVGGLSEQVTVESGAPLLQTGTAEISDVIDNRQVVEIPLNGRQFLSLAQLSDSVVIPPGGTRGDALQQAGPLPNVGGQRSGHNIYLLDGVKVTDELFNNLVVNPSVDSIQEFKIQKSMYAPEFGGKASALINVATKAGTNDFDGSAFGFLRDEAFDARNYFTPAGQPTPALRQSQYGGSLGGPLRRSRTFAFVSYEAQQTTRAETRTFSVPSAAVRNGDFAGLAPICDPAAIDPGTGDCTPFAGNRIPSNRLDPIAVAFLQHVPPPMSIAALQNLAAVDEQHKDVHQFGLRIDHRAGASNQLFARISTFDADEVQPFGTSALQETLVPGFGRVVDTHTTNAVVSFTQVLGNTSLNEIRAGYMRVHGGQQNRNRGYDFAGQVGLLGVTRDPRDAGFPQISTSGLYSTFGDPATTVYRDNEHFEIYDNLVFDRRNHRLKIGAYWFHLRLRPEQPDNARGAFRYSGQFTGNAFADFLLGYPASATSSVGRGDEDGRTQWLHAYAQDDWRVRDTLTINYGLRYEYNQHMRAADNRLSSVDLTTPGGRFVIASDDEGNVDPSASELLPLIPIPYVTSEDADWDRGLLSPSYVRLAPRVGFALSARDSRAVIRGGYGVFLNQWAYSVQTAFAKNLPFFYVKQVDVPGDAKSPPFETRDVLVTTQPGTAGANIMDHDYAVEYTQTWSGGLQYEVRPGLMFEASYMGSWTRGADNSTIRNVPDPGAGPIQARRPLPLLSAIRAIRFDGKSLYNGLVLKIDRPLRRLFALTASYTLSKSTDDASSPGATESEANVPQDVRNIFPGQWALSSFDHRHQLIASATYLVPSPPSGARVLAAAFSDWRVSAVATVQSGAPFTVSLGVDRANIGAGPEQRPDQLNDPNLPGGERTPERWFDTSAFALQAPFTFGSAPRNSVTAPGYANVDLALARTIPLSGSARLEFRWEVFNTLNRVNFDLPNRVFGSPNFGRIFSAKNAREMQFGLRATF